MTTAQMQNGNEDDDVGGGERMAYIFKRNLLTELLQAPSQDRRSATTKIHSKQGKKSSENYFKHLKDPSGNE